MGQVLVKAREIVYDIAGYIAPIAQFLLLFNTFLMTR